MNRYLIGAGGHATVIEQIAKKSKLELNGVFTDIGAKNITNLKFVDDINNIINYQDSEFMLAFGNVEIRQKLEKYLSSNNVKWFSLIDRNAMVYDNVRIGVGTVIMPGAIINSGAQIGNHVIINSGVIVEHGCKIGNHVHMSPGSVICGNSIIGDGTWIGAGTTIIDGIKIGNNVIVGAGSVVIRDIDSNTIEFGVPAHKKSLRK